MANENGLIRVGKAVHDMCQACSEHAPGIECEPKHCSLVEALRRIPTVDAVEVVRCKDCKWRNTRGCPYMNFNATVRDDSDYCSDGERKKDHE